MIGVEPYGPLTKTLALLFDYILDILAVNWRFGI